MDNLFIRIFIISLALFGVYKMFPQISGPVDYYVKNPKFQSSVVSPAVNMANNVLPDKIQIPTPKVMGVDTEYTGDSPLKTITDEISKQAASLAASQIEQIRKTASDQFCNALLEKIKTECGK
ncbi:MAG: hypothetical protein UW68_C0010G0010 [Candidatus Collierbacteria bacterium GW2011_GWB1_44_6]|uniref:Uncharacterized protein n=2 Tax=Candidatus Collieribacteriota TaxID=1752725 RepID=A0A0G1MN06_9BACT|nr:MAG: hypothetical protein UV68_C0005G0022 [Candidatus Collierbacteria bacterium GW2011_GWC2_43_12]KKT73399.1 MAG: hypothetical protein UW68_C0010G0010 [Candidatus Collierbacteria bacterium GW2011_GWB1_44_6]KKT82906.1 MAG: hypothetical protein UW80_C0027G0012 [Microgenomates group bacterium GW2011_GWC1_44_9]